MPRASNPPPTRNLPVTTRRRLTTVMACAWALAVAAPGLSHAQSRPAPAAKPLARYVPAKDLIFYVEVDGLDAHAAAWKKSALYKVLNETKMGAMLDDLLAQGITQMLAASDDKAKPTPAELIGMYKATIRDGAAFGFAGNPRDEKSMVGVGVFRNGARNGLLDFIKRSETATGQKSKSERRGSRTIFRSNPGSPAWWAEGDDLVLAMADALVDPLIAVIDGKAPNATTKRAPQRADEAGGRLRAGRGRLRRLRQDPDAARRGAGRPRRPQAARLPDRVSGRRPLQCLSRDRPGAERGVLAWVEQPTFDKNTLPPIPAGLTSWTAFSFSPGALWGKVSAWTKQEAAAWAARRTPPPPGMILFEQNVQRTLGFRVKEDFLDQLGPKWVFYVNGEPPPKGQAMGKVRAALTAEVRDSAAPARTLDKLMAVVMQALQQQAAQNPQAKLPQVRKVEGPTPGYRLTLPPGTLPPQMDGLIDPTILVGKCSSSSHSTGPRPAPR